MVNSGISRTEPASTPSRARWRSLHAFEKWLESRLGSRLSSRFAYLVSLPYTDVPRDKEMAGCPRSLILDQTDMKSPAELVRHAVEHEGNAAIPLAPSFLERIVPHLSGDLNTDFAVPVDPQEAEDTQDHPNRMHGRGRAT